MKVPKQLRFAALALCNLMGLTGLISLTGSSAALAQAADYPSRGVRLIVPYGPGTPPDISSRVIAQRLSLALGQSVFVDNKPGSIGMIGTGDLLRQPADGYTLMTLLTPMVVAPVLIESAKVDFAKDIVPVGQYDWTYSVLVVPPTLPARNMKELLELMRSRGGKVNFASGGYGTPAHLAGELFKMQNSVAATHVPYNQFTAGLTDLFAGRVDFMFLTSTVAVGNVQGGKLRALAVAADKRLDTLPEVSTVAEQGFRNFDVRNWDGIVAKAGTPAAIVERLNRELNKLLAAGDVRDRLRDVGADANGGTPAAFAELIANDTRRFTDLVKKANIKIE